MSLVAALLLGAVCTDAEAEETDETRESLESGTLESGTLESGTLESGTLESRRASDAFTLFAALISRQNNNHNKQKPSHQPILPI